MPLRTYEVHVSCRQQVKGVAALNAQPAFLNTNKPDIHTIKDFTDQDRIGRITNAKGVVEIAGGPFRIVAVEQLESHLDLSLFEP